MSGSGTVKKRSGFATLQHSVMLPTKRIAEKSNWIGSRPFQPYHVEADLILCETVCLNVPCIYLDHGRALLLSSGVENRLHSEHQHVNITVSRRLGTVLNKEDVPIEESGLLTTKVLRQIGYSARDF